MPVVWVTSERGRGFSQCGSCGADVYSKNQVQHSNWHETFIHRAEVREGFAVSAVKWCDVGDHAYKAGAPGSQTLQATQTNEDGMTETSNVDVCGDHNFNLKQPKQAHIVQELQQAYPVDTRETIDERLGYPAPVKPRYMSDER